jgi:hypothetical protein
LTISVVRDSRGEIIAANLDIRKTYACGPEPLIGTGSLAKRLPSLARGLPSLAKLLPAKAGQVRFLRKGKETDMKALIFAVFVTAAFAQQKTDPERAAERIHQAQYAAAVERRAQHREIERVQPASLLEPELATAQRKARADRLVVPDRTGAK